MIRDFGSDISEEDIASFCESGFHIMKNSIFNDPKNSLPSLMEHLENVLNGECDRGRPPFKVNNAHKIFFGQDGRFFFDAAGPSGAQRKPPRSKTIHIINIWQADTVFQSLVTSSLIGATVTKLMGWESAGCRVAQDQVWIKPPNSGPLSYHRDTPYIDFTPKEVCTAWIPFSLVSKESGTLEYCWGSHKWSTERRGSANQFYDNNYKAMLLSAAAFEAEKQNAKAVCSSQELPIHYVLTPEGGCSFHNGNTWHGSSNNTTSKWRCGIGIHFVKGDALLSDDMGPLWRSLQGSSDQFPRHDVFPKTA